MTSANPGSDELPSLPPQDRPANFGANRSAAVLVVSGCVAGADGDDAARGDAAGDYAAGGHAAVGDRGGQMLVTWLRGLGYQCPEPTFVADGPPVGEALRRVLTDRPVGDRPRIVVTTGGTGLNPRDQTPQETERLLDHQVPGIMHALWSKGLSKVPTAVMSRGVVGVIGPSLVVNLPGSTGGVRDGIVVLDGLIHHIQAQLEDYSGL